MRSNLPDSSYFIGKSIPEEPTISIRELVGGGNNGLVFHAYSSQLETDLACKIIPRINLIGSELTPPTWIAEVHKANVLKSVIAVKFFRILSWKDEGSGIDCVVLCSEYVLGKNLRNYIKDEKAKVRIDFIERFLAEMLDFLNELKTKRIQHGDLHSGNIIVEDRATSLSGPKFAFRVTDFGVAPATSHPLLKNDFEQTAAILRELLNNVDYQEASARDRYAYNVLNDHFLARHLVESDPTRDEFYRNPRMMFERLTRIDVEYIQQQSLTTNAKLTTPFDYLSCEQLGDSHSLLKALYSGLFLGLIEVESRNNIVLTGPRGCGKSTVFKSLSLKHRGLTESAVPDDVKYIGIYYRCDDLYFAFPRYQTPDRKEAVDIPMHFVASTLLIDVLDTIQIWALKHFNEEFLKGQSAIVSRLREILSINEPQDPGSGTFDSLKHQLRKERVRAANKQRLAHDPKHSFGMYFGADILIKSCQEIVKGLSFLTQRPFYFFIDDYSSPKITKALQENLNRLFMTRTESCFFKLSTESPVSYSRSDIDSKSYVEGREFSLLNLGRTYLHGDPTEKLHFIDDVFNRRLRTVSNYPVDSIEKLLGSNSDGDNQNELARAIRAGKKPDIWGRETIANLCSGDIHYVISLVGKMVTSIGGPTGIAASNANPIIPARVQNKTIREEAGAFLNSIRGVLKHGEKLASIVSAFGAVANSYLKYRTSKNQTGAPPHQASRIEPFEDPSLIGENKELYDELLRYSIFIEDVRGKSRRGKVVPRLYLRRFLIPHFNLTFSTRDSVELEVHEFELLLSDPDAFEKKMRLKEETIIDENESNNGTPLLDQLDSSERIDDAN